MAEPASAAPESLQEAPHASGLLRPRYVFPALLLLVVATVLLTPVESARRGDPRLTSRSAESQGARGLYELAGRLGWRTSRRTTPFTSRGVAGRGEAGARAAAPEAPLADSVVYAVLDPPTDLSAAEAGALLAAVRRGAGLLVVLSRGSTLADSLAIRPSLGGARQVDAEGRDSPDSCPEDASKRGAIDWPGGRVYSYWLEPRAPLPAGTIAFATLEAPQRERRTRRAADSGAGVVPDPALRVPGTPPAVDSATLDEDEEEESDFDPDTVRRLVPGDESASVATPVNAGARDARDHRAAIVGFPLGAGRVVAVADPDWLRNDVLRVCEWNAGVQAARMLEYLAARPGGSRDLVFDEYHQGFGRHPSTLRVIRRALFDDPLGRTTTQAIVAALVLLAAVGARGVPPRSHARLARRSPLEHVGALSRAYAQIGATRLATRRLVRGIRRRHGGWGTSLGGTPRSAGRAGESDDVFLGAIGDRFPALAADVALLREAVASPVSPERLLEVGRAAGRVERTLAGGRAGPARASDEPAPAR